MERAILLVHFPRGKVPARGFQCPVCGDERLLADDVSDVRNLAAELGLYGIENASTRKLLRTGTSVAVTLDPGLVRDVLHGAKPGDPVKVGRQGGRIVIEPS